MTKILTNELSQAVGACEAALEKRGNKAYLTAISEKAAKASIYSNLAVAKALAGDLSAAALIWSCPVATTQMTKTHR